MEWRIAVVRARPAGKAVQIIAAGEDLPPSRKRNGID